jgi:SAM-dependent methyltransferase
MNFTPSFTRYLAAKKSVDDRALNRNVWDTFRHALLQTTIDKPLRVLEIGAGIGTMIERLVEHNALTDAAYTAIDADPDNIAELNRRVSKMQNIVVEAHATDVFDFIAQEQGQRTWDVLIAHAFLDLVDIPRKLPSLFSLLRRDGLFYFTLVFDGVTTFEPTIDAEFDAEIERLYHQTMDERIIDGKRSGDSRAGRHLFHPLHQAGAEILQAGSSNWVVYSTGEGYLQDEAYFLRFIIHTLCSALEDQPALKDRREQFRDWIATRYRQIEEQKLVYIAHQLDFVGMKR